MRSFEGSFGCDYDFDYDDSTVVDRDLIFFTAPSNGATITVATQSYFVFVEIYIFVDLGTSLTNKFCKSKLDISLN